MQLLWTHINWKARWNICAFFKSEEFNWTAKNLQMIKMVKNTGDIDHLNSFVRVTKQCMRWNISPFDISLNPKTSISVLNWILNLIFSLSDPTKGYFLNLKKCDHFKFLLHIECWTSYYLSLQNKRYTSSIKRLWLNELQKNDQVIFFQNENCIQTWAGRGRWRSVWGPEVCLNDLWPQASPASSS